MRKGPGVYLSFEAADEITICNLRDAIETVEKNLAVLQKLKDPSAAQKEDIVGLTKILVHLKAVLKYYGGSDV